MSRVGKKPINIPKDVTITLNDKNLSVKGKFGLLEREIKNLVTIIIENQKLIITRIDNNKKTREYHGLIRALIQNMITGVDEKFSKILIAEGVGYKFQVEKEKLVLNVGFTHPIEFIIPSELNIKLESPTKIQISGIDREKVGFLSAKIRDMRPPEPYKGKGILYQGEKIIRKAGKTGK
jgi:large subunit ribosomal protein L6